MKTKIIYISGNEVFEMSEIRAAFDSVRAALGLDNDTILFGVPVDADNALSNIDITPATDVAPVAEAVVEPESEAVVEPVVELVAEPIIEPVVEVVPVAEIEPDPIVDSVPEISEIPETEPVVPILSILSAQETSIKSAVEAVAEPIVETSAEPVVESVVDTVVEPATEPVETAIISDINVNAELSAPVDTVDDAVGTVTIGDMITDAAPVPQMEKTLEELLETMAPLREDVQPAPVAEVPADVFNGDDTDATLAQLATEFADTQDKIPATPRSSTTGKIGKLKNILPFKKAKRDDNGLMGDLFGWAGIAANDEDFSIPGFFTPAASKKQGA